MRNDNSTLSFENVPNTDDLIARTLARRRMRDPKSVAKTGVNPLEKKPVLSADDKRPLHLRVLMDRNKS